MQRVSELCSPPIGGKTIAVTPRYFQSVFMGCDMWYYVVQTGLRVTVRIDSNRETETHNKGKPALRGEEEAPKLIKQ